METFLQPIILLLLLILLIDRFYFKTEQKSISKKTLSPKKNTQIMGESKMALNKTETTKESNNTIEKDSRKVVPTEVLDDIFNSPNTKTIIENEWELAEEEEELKSSFSKKNDNDFATGLSFEELQKIPTLLTQKELTIPLAVKIADTELLEVLNEQIPEAEKLVAELLNRHLSTYNQPKINDDWRDFDIQKFT
jgi:hypothetical protein